MDADTTVARLKQTRRLQIFEMDAACEGIRQLAYLAVKTSDRAQYER